MTEGVSANGAGLRVLHILRAPNLENFSIERVYADVRGHIDPRISVEVWESPFASRGILSRLRAIFAMRALQADVYHVTGDVHFLTLGLRRPRTVLTVHDTEFLDRASGIKRTLLWFFWFRLSLPRCRRIIAISEQTARDLRRVLPSIASRIEVIPNPVSIGFRHVPAGGNTESGAPLRILQIGTKTNKNLDRLARALQGLNVHLTIIGRLSQAQRVQFQACGIDHLDQSALTDDELQRAYVATDVVAFCSLSEGFGLPILEAQATGRPVITSDREPMSDVAGGAALLVDPEDVQAMRAGFTRLIAEPDLRADLIARGLRNVERFSAKKIAAAYARLYLSIAGVDASEVEP